MKKCSKCDNSKDEKCFAKNKSRKGGLSGFCKECQKIYIDKHYIDNKKYYLTKAKKHNRIRISVFDKFIRRIKSIPCIDCGGVFHFSAMDFDHVNGSKVYAISRMKTLSMQSVMDEILKCEIVCSNCHRVRTWKRLNPDIA